MNLKTKRSIQQRNFLRKQITSYTFVEMPNRFNIQHTLALFRENPILKRKKLCEKSIYWVLSYRNAPRKKHIELYRYGFVEGHTDESWKWTLRESETIHRKGFEFWFYRTDGPYGFRYSNTKT